MNKQNVKKKKPIQILREQKGGVSQELKNSNREQTKIIKKLVKDIKDNYKTIPEISKSISIPSNVVIWHLMALKKYGKVIEGEEKEGYFKYTYKDN